MDERVRERISQGDIIALYRPAQKAKHRKKITNRFYGSFFGERTISFFYYFYFAVVSSESASHSFRIWQKST